VLRALEWVHERPEYRGSLAVHEMLGAQLLADQAHFSRVGRGRRLELEPSQEKDHVPRV